MAGADSTSIAMRSIFYFLMKKPDTLVRLRAEIDAAFTDGRLSTPIQYNQSVQLLYLGAVIKESFRLYSPFAVSFQRYAPPQGIMLAGTHIAAGMRVGINPAVSQHYKEIFGADADSFRPERWLDSGGEQVKLMDRNLMFFGVGTRRCTGKNVRTDVHLVFVLADNAQVAMSEIQKIVPEIVRRFDFHMTHDGPWKTHNAGFNVQTGMTCRFRRRQVV
jgi:cytochrome P450